MPIRVVALLWWNLTDDSGSTTPSTGAPTVAEGNAADPVRGRTEAQEAPTRIEAEIDRVEAVASPGKLEDSTELRILATWPDQSPAAEAMVTLRRSVPGLPYAADARKLTNADGLAVFEDVPRGPSTLESDREDRKKITVEGGRQEVSFELKGDIAVRGTVKSPPAHRSPTPASGCKRATPPRPVVASWDSPTQWASLSWTRFCRRCRWPPSPPAFHRPNCWTYIVDTSNPPAVRLRRDVHLPRSNHRA